MSRAVEGLSWAGSARWVRRLAGSANDSYPGLQVAAVLERRMVVVPEPLEVEVEFDAVRRQIQQVASYLWTASLLSRPAHR